MAMGRVPGTLLLALFVALLFPPAALAVDGDGETTFRRITLPADHGLRARLEADDDEIELRIVKPHQHQLAIYSAEGEVSAEGVAVKFGRLGEFVADYEPIRTLGTHGPNRHCTGEPKTATEGYFRGAIRFRGEGGYIHINAARVKGQLFLRPAWDCDFGRADASGAGDGEAGDDEATLTARSGRDPITFSVFGWRGEEEPTQSAFIALSAERREGVNIVRYTSTGSGPAGFEFDNGNGTALVDPPPPFAGSARYVRRPHGRDSWRGSLTGPLLGLGRVRLAGPGFDARMVPMLPNFE